MKILVLNCRIHSVEFELFEMPQEKELCRGVIDKIGSDDTMLYFKQADKTQIKQKVVAKGGGEKVAVVDHKNAVEIILKKLSEYKIDAVGHRIVHGGEKYFQSVVITDEVKKEIYRNFEFAPLHNPYNFQGIEAVEKFLPNTPQVAVFDTAFHQTLPEVAYRYPIPEGLYQQYRIRKYGFHGISHRYVTERTAALLKKPIEKTSLISIHLGQGSSLCAIKNGISVETSMGFTPLEGVMMTTRSGNIDPGMVFFLYKSGWSINDIENCLNKESGVLGISNISAEMKDVVEAYKKGDKKAALAIEMFVYHIRQYLGAYYLLLAGKIDAISFTGGIGENSDIIREKICQNLAFLKVQLDEEKNKKAISKQQDISKKSSKVKIFVIPRNEKIVIARDVYNVIMK